MCTIICLKCIIRNKRFKLHAYAKKCAKKYAQYAKNMQKMRNLRIKNQYAKYALPTAGHFKFADERESESESPGPWHGVPTITSEVDSELNSAGVTVRGCCQSSLRLNGGCG